MKNSIPWWMRLKFLFLFFGVTMSILPLFFLGYLGFTSVTQNLKQNIREQNFEQVTVLANETGDFFNRIEDSLILTAATSAHDLVGNNETSRQIILKTLLQRESVIEEIKVMDEKFAGKTIENPLSQGTSSSISEVFYSPDGRPKVYLTVAVQDPITQERIGYLQSKIDLTRIIKSFVNIRLDEGEYVFLVDHAGNLIDHSDDFSRISPKGDIRQNPAVQSFLEGETSSLESEHKNQDGVNVVGAYASLDIPNWAVFIEQPTHEANKPIYALGYRLIMIAILIMVLVMILSVAFGLKIVQPIENLEGQVRRIISTGDLQSHIPIESWDEIGRLVQSFNQLLNSLNQKNESIKNEKELLTTVVDGIGAGMVLLNAEEKIIWCNTKFEEWFGPQLANLPCNEVVKGEGIESFYLENGRNILVSVNEERRHFRQMHYELSPDNPEKAAFVLLLEDVTQEVEMEARMIETDKMAAIGLLASGVAHEINNPLAVAAAQSEDLLDRLREEEAGLIQEEIKIGFKIVLDQTSRCKQITERLLSYAHKRSEGREPMDIGASSEQAFGLLQHKTKQNRIRLETQLENELFVLGNENEWQQVVLNLLANALDASAFGGVIEVKGWHEEEIIHFTVKDYGGGISVNNLKKVFDPFFTTKSVGQGTGLGLYVSYGIVQKMQGNLALESKEGQGTCVKITLPLYKVGD